MSSRDAPPLTADQVNLEAFWTARLAQRGTSVGWGRNANGAYHALFADDALAAWREAYALGYATGLEAARAKTQREIGPEAETQFLHTPAQPTNTENRGIPNDTTQDC